MSKNLVGRGRSNLRARRGIAFAITQALKAGRDVEADFSFNLLLSVIDPGLLWQGAATALAAQSPTLLDEDIIDTLGSREAPNLTDCLTMLLFPTILPGGSVQQVICLPVMANPGGVEHTAMKVD